jgi:segregation and condensation protein B
MSKKKKAEQKPVTLIEDPYGFNTLDISDAQSNEDELILDEIDEAAAAEKLSKIAEAVAEAEAVSKAEAEAAPETPEENAEAELAAQIAEDQALQAEIRAEEAEAAKADASPLLGASGELDLAEVQSCVEALLFISDKPLSAKRLKDLLGPDFETSVFEQAVARVQEQYQATHHGFELVEVNGGFQFRTKPGRANLARKLVKVQVQRLSGGAMETLALVAYKQPVMKEEIDKVRGVDSSYFIRGLLDRKLIKISGRSELPGRPMLYVTTDEFLELFGLADLSALPALHEIEKMIPASEIDKSEKEDPRVAQMRRMVQEMKSGSDQLAFNPKEDAQILQEIRERVGAIPTTTPYLEEQKANEKIAKLQAELADKIVLELAPELPTEMQQAQPPMPLIVVEGVEGTES